MGPTLHCQDKPGAQLLRVKVLAYLDWECLPLAGLSPAPCISWPRAWGGMQTIDLPSWKALGEDLGGGAQGGATSSESVQM